ncbi:MAG TPA: rhodanese-like domain-containing protein [Candidatus Krumholzibacteria bacterium]|nr:rhodanese-like domain-containing protein [Candidatus Krumholzibacteria bacterium]
MKHSKGFLELVHEARHRVHTTDVATVWNRVDSGEAFHLIDIREDHEWGKGHIPGSIHLGRGILERDIERTIPDPNTEIVLYCGGGYRSVLSADALQRMGYKNVLSMDGGYTGWVDAGHPVKK